MELVVATLALLGIGASVVRFLPRDDAGRIVLPSVVDQSIGMWLLRRLTGRLRLPGSGGVGGIHVVYSELIRTYSAVRSEK